MKYSKHKLEKILLRWLNSIMIAAFIIASVIGLVMQHRMQHNQVFSVMNSYLKDCVKDIDVQKSAEFNFFDNWMDYIDSEEEGGKERFFNNGHLEYIANSKGNSDLLCEISIVDLSGTVIHSSNPELIGVNIEDNDSLRPLRCLLEGETVYTDDVSKNPFNDQVKIAYFAKTFRDGSGFMVFGFNEKNYEFTLIDEIKEGTRNAKVGENGYFIACDLDKNILSLPQAMEEKAGDVFSEAWLLPENVGEIKNTITTLYGERAYVSAIREPEYYIVNVYPQAEADRFMLQNNVMAVVLFFTVLSVFFITFFIVIKSRVIRDVEKTHSELKLITEGDLDEKVDASGSLEFAELSDGINETVGKLKDLIREEDERVKAELQNAKKIQESAVPKVFPKDERFELYASMNTAEAVGGDFYDFFMRDENTLVLVMADVSGKGMPAALYMMRAKTLIRTCAELGLPVDEIAIEANKRLCEDDSLGMFVTAWIGLLELDTGVLSYVHAGHTMPVLVRRDNASENAASFVKQEIDMVLGAFEDAGYMRQEIRLAPGDSIFLYTDGVTEANDVNKEMYGEERLLSFITGNMGDSSCKAACEAVLSDVNAFADGAAQFDDITMMWVKYYGEK